MLLNSGKSTNPDFQCYQVAFSILAIPASSGASEKMFSTAGWLSGDRKNRLSGENFRSQVFLSGNPSTVNFLHYNRYFYVHKNNKRGFGIKFTKIHLQLKCPMKNLKKKIRIAVSKTIWRKSKFTVVFCYKTPLCVSFV